MMNSSIELALARHGARLVEVEESRRARRAAANRRLRRRAERLAGRAQRVTRRAERAAAQARLSLARAV